jgi:phosphoribosylformylglycinamidine synthase
MMKGRADVVGDAVILIGSSTGRDGIGGASVLASAEFDDESDDKRPAVQVGDPFTEKLLIEACLELVERDLIDGLQDLGAGGISCPSSEMTAKCGTGIALDLDRVHLRESGMEPFEVMISESQERMMAVTDHSRVSAVLETCERWGLRAETIGEITSTGRIEVKSAGETVADAPVEALAEDGPVYDRPLAKPEWMDELASARNGDAAPDDLGGAFLALLGSPNIASKRWIWEQYDHMIFLGTFQGPGADAAVIRLPDSKVAAVISTDGPGRYCYLDPYMGAVSAVAEAARNVVCTGARPLAVTNCLNFGNPEKPEVMWQFSEVVRGMSDACEALGTPVTGGNVSFYNETKGRPIHPTPVIGMLGGLDDATSSVGSAFVAEDQDIVLLGVTDPQDFGGSEYAAVVNAALGGKPPRVDLEAEVTLQTLLARCTRERLITSAHDCSGGGLAMTLAESALRSNIGFRIALGEGEPHRALFSESASRVVVTCDARHLPALLEAAEIEGFPATHLGTTGGSELDLDALVVVLDDARHVFETAIPSLLEGRVGA